MFLADQGMPWDARLIRVFIDIGVRLSRATNFRWDTADETVKNIDWSVELSGCRARDGVSV